MRNIFILFFTIFIINACGGGSSSNLENSSNNPPIKNTPTSTSIKDNDEFNQESYKGLQFYYRAKDIDSYNLAPLSDNEFNSLSKEQKLQVANRLLTSLFWGYPLKELQNKIESGVFISSIFNGLKEDKTNKEWLESYIRDESNFKQYTKPWEQPEVITILSRFYAAKELDKYYMDNWIAYILTQTILFSPAYELSSTHSPDISQVYNHLVLMLQNGSGMRFITYVHMMSQENWRRFRSPEDNGREMLEIYLQDTKDSDVPLAAKALQNWRLNPDGDTLEVGLNQNRTPIKLFGTTIYTGEDFYRELVKSDAFVKGVTNRLVDFFFPEYSSNQKSDIVSKILTSKPETWQDILLQIIFSKEYLLHNHRALSAEESFFSIAKKIGFRHRLNTFGDFKYQLDNMHQATMKYKLGKLDRVPLDTLSFAWYHKYIRENLLLNSRYEDETDKDSWKYDGWGDDFVSLDNFEHDSNNDVSTLRNFVNYLFNATIARDAKEDEQKFFKDFMIEQRDGKELFKWDFNVYITYDDKDKEAKWQSIHRRNIATAVLDYISRLQDCYYIQGVK